MFKRKRSGPGGGNNGGNNGGSTDEERDAGGEKGREGGEDELVVGRQAVLEALRLSKPLRIILAEGLKGAIINEITLLARQRKVPVQRLTRVEFTNEAGDIEGCQGVAAFVPPFKYSSLDELIATSRYYKEEPFLLMIDHVEDPRNLGAVMRTADAAGVHGLIIPDRRACGVTAATRKVASGAAERLSIALVGNLNQAAETLKKEGFWIYGAEADGDHDFYRADFKRPLVLVVGSEGKGVSPLLRKNCDLTVSIPMPGAAASSLNVSAAAAVLIYAVLARRGDWYS